MIRRSGNKIYTKVTQYFTDNSSTVGYSHFLTSPTESFCGTNFYYEQRLTSSLANGKWRDCLYGPFTFCSGSTSGSACTSSNCSQFYLDTSTINIDYTGVVVDDTSNITLYTGSRLYLSSSLELAPDGYYASGSTYYKIGNGDCCGINNGTFILSGSCGAPPPPPSCLCYYILNPTGGTLTYEYNNCVSGYTNASLAGGANIQVCSSNVPSGTGLTIEACVDTTTCTTNANCTGCSSAPPCLSVTVDAYGPPGGQGGTTNIFGAYASIPYAVGGSITVNGLLRKDGDVAPSSSFSLTISAGQTYAETGMILTLGPADNATVVNVTYGSCTVPYDGMTLNICNC